MIALLPVLLACQSPAPVPTPDWEALAPTLELSAPWQVAHQTKDEVALQLADSPHGVRVRLAPSPTEGPAGVTLIHNGRTLELADEGHAPMFAFPHPEHALTTARILVQGIDLVVRVEGPPLDQVTDHPDADSRPTVTQVRVRPRQEDWRIVVEGTPVVSLAGPLTEIGYANNGGWSLASSWGQFSLQTAAPSHNSTLSHHWRLDLEPAIEATEPYPRTTITWRP